MEVDYLSLDKGTMEDCSICYEAVSDSTGHCTLSCKHTFHIQCLTRWSAENPNCPMCRRELGKQEKPVNPDPPPSVWTSEAMVWIQPGQGRIREFMDAIRHHDHQPPPPPYPRPVEINIRDDMGNELRVQEGDIGLVMAQAEVTRGEAIRALRRYDGDIVNSILMLTSPNLPVAPRPPPVPRDPMVEQSDDQATAWFLQQMFDDSPYYWNSYFDMVGRGNRSYWKRHEYWRNEDFNDVKYYDREYDSE